jgi:hypothetical protein
MDAQSFGWKPEGEQPLGKIGADRKILDWVFGE